jgi:hypothetical protein
VVVTAEVERGVGFEGRINVGLKGLIAATASIALMAAPTVAAAQTTAMPATENVSGMQLTDEDGPNWFVLLGVGVAVALLIWVLLDDDDDAPTSP